jgi:hypothetical protein
MEKVEALAEAIRKAEYVYVDDDRVDDIITHYDQIRSGKGEANAITLTSLDHTDAYSLSLTNDELANARVVENTISVDKNGFVYAHIELFNRVPALIEL